MQEEIVRSAYQARDIYRLLKTAAVVMIPSCR